jgi:hypothetical protein
MENTPFWGHPRRPGGRGRLLPGKAPWKISGQKHAFDRPGRKLAPIIQNRQFLHLFDNSMAYF